MTAAKEGSGAGLVAQALGYLVGTGSLFLYTPIAIRVCRQRDASGLTLSTWWLKLISYTLTNVYSFANGYPISTYVETIIITVEAFVVLVLVAFYQRRLGANFACIGLSYVLASTWGITAAPLQALELGQTFSTLTNTGALMPQLQLNARSRSAGGYSPLTAGLACAGCLIRVFTTIELTGADPSPDRYF